MGLLKSKIMNSAEDIINSYKFTTFTDENTIDNEMSIKSVEHYLEVERNPYARKELINELRKLNVIKTNIKIFHILSVS